MWKMIVRRVLVLIPQLFIISLVTFALGVMMPGDALSGMIDPSLSPEAIQNQRELLGLDDPLPVRYIQWMFGRVAEENVVNDDGTFEYDADGNIVTRYRWRGGIIRGDFGQSFTHRRPVTTLIGERVANTFWLSLATMILTYLLAIPLGVLAGRYKGTLVDKGILFYVFVALAMPTLVLSILMILFFAFQLGWFPRGGSVDAMIVGSGDTWAILTNRLYHMVLPAMTGAVLGTIGIIFRLRANIIDRTYSEYVTLARSKGVPTGIIFRRHILRNSLIPVAAGFGFAISGLLMGQLFIEQIFQYPGMGLLFFQSVMARDFAVVNAIIIIFSMLSALGMLISDILLTIVDPRIRIE